ncbi:hypothetical protein Tco_0073502 [Tanacetum coccineum]
MSSDSTSSEEPDSPEVAPASPEYVPGPKEPEQAPPSPVYIPGPEYPEYLAPVDDEIVAKDHPYADYAEVDPEEDSEDGPVDYLVDRGDKDDDDSSDDDEEEEEASKEEEEHLALADSVVAPVVDHVPSAEETESFETDESVATPPLPPAYRTTVRISIQAQVPIPFPSKAEVDRLLAIPTPPSSPLSPWSSPLPQIPSPPLPSLPLPSPPLPSLPTSIFIPPPVDRREDTPEAELPPRKRLCLTAPTSRFEMGESSTATARPTGGHRADYGFIGTLDAEIRCQRAEKVSYGIRDVWVDLAEAVEEVAPTTLKRVNDRVTELAGVQKEDTQEIYAETVLLMEQEALVSREAWAYDIGCTNFISTGQLSVALGQIQTLQARDQTHADNLEGTDSCA